MIDMVDAAAVVAAAEDMDQVQFAAAVVDIQWTDMIEVHLMEEALIPILMIVVLRHHLTQEATMMLTTRDGHMMTTTAADHLHPLHHRGQIAMIRIRMSPLKKDFLAC